VPLEIINVLIFLSYLREGIIEKPSGANAPPPLKKEASIVLTVHD